MSSSSTGPTAYLDISTEPLDFTEYPVGYCYRINLHIPAPVKVVCDIIGLELFPTDEEDPTVWLWIKHITQEEINVMKSSKFRLNTRLTDKQILDVTIPGQALVYLQPDENDEEFCVSDVREYAEKNKKWLEENGFGDLSFACYHDTLQLIKYTGLAMVAALRRGLIWPVLEKTEEEKLSVAVEKLSIAKGAEDME